MDRSLRTSLLSDNPWLTSIDRLGAWLRARLPQTYYLRHASRGPRLRWHEPDRAHLVIGPRQAGKSTLIWSYLAEIGKPVLLIDCEQRLVQEWCRSAPLFLADLGTLVSAPVPLFFDEVQHLQDAGLFFKGLVDRRIGVPILVTGSSSYHLGAQTRESLAGRATRTRLLPFSFHEKATLSIVRTPGAATSLAPWCPSFLFHFFRPASWMRWPDFSTPPV